MLIFDIACGMNRQMKDFACCVSRWLWNTVNLKKDHKNKHSFGCIRGTVMFASIRYVSRHWSPGLEMCCVVGSRQVTRLSVGTVGPIQWLINKVGELGTWCGFSGYNSVLVSQMLCRLLPGLKYRKCNNAWEVKTEQICSEVDIGLRELEVQFLWTECGLLPSHAHSTAFSDHRGWK